MRIGELAKAANCSVETIRYYEQQQLIPEPYRNQSNYRLYNKSHLDRLKFIRNCRSLDMTHEEIRGLLTLLDTPEENCMAVSQLLEEHIEHVNIRITELQNLQQQLIGLRKYCSDSSSIDQCGIVQELTAMEIPSSHKTHLG